MRTRCQRPLSRAPSSVKSRWPLASPLCGSPSGSQRPRSQTIIAPPPYSPFGMLPSKSRYSIGWSSVRTASRFSPSRQARARASPPSSSARRRARAADRSAAGAQHASARRTARGVHSRGRASASGSGVRAKSRLLRIFRRALVRRADSRIAFGFGVFARGHDRSGVSGGRASCISQYFKRPLGARRPRRVAVEREIAPPPRRRFGVPLQPLEQQRQIEHRVGIVGIGVERALAGSRSPLGAALVVEHIGEVVPGLGEVRIGLDGGPIGGLRFDVLARSTRSTLPRLNGAAGSAGIDASSPADRAARPSRCRSLSSAACACSNSCSASSAGFSTENELAGLVGAALHLLDQDRGRRIPETAADSTGRASGSHLRISCRLRVMTDSAVAGGEQPGDLARRREIAEAVEPAARPRSGRTWRAARRPPAAARSSEAIWSAV